MDLGLLTLSNFLCFESAQIDLQNRGLVAIVGLNKEGGAFDRNGVGKSAILDAICWVLFGKTLRGLEASDVIRRGTKNCQVSVQIHDGEEVYIVRRKRSSSKTELSLEKHLKNDEVSDASSFNISDTQNKIETILGMDFQTFQNVVIFGDDVVRFARATDREQKAILDKILDSEQYERALEIVKSKIKENEAKLSENSSLRLRAKDAKESALRDAEDLINRAEMLRQSVVSQKESIQVDIKKLQDSLVSIQYQITEIESDRRTTEPTRIPVDLESEKSLASILSQEKSANETIQLCDRELKSLSLLRSRMTTLKCNQCGQTVNQSEFDRQIAEIDEKIKKWETKVGPPKQYLASGAKVEKQQLMDKIQANRLLIKENELQIAGFKDRQRKLDGLKREKAVLETKLESLKNTSPDDSGAIAMESKAEELALRAEELETNIGKINDIIGVIEADRKKLEFWKDGFGPGGIRSFLLDSVAGFLNERSNHYSQTLTDGTIRIEFCTQTELKTGEKREKFQVRAVNQYGSDIYSGNSGGERQRIDICVALALNDLSRSRATKSLGLVFYDEVFERVDAAGADRIIRLLRQNKDLWPSCFITSHNSDLVQMVPHSVLVIKEGGKSIIKENN